MPAEASHQNGHAAVDVRGALKEGIARLRDAGISSFTLTAEVLLMHATERDRTWLFAHPDQILDAPAAQKYFAMIDRRVAGEPTQYITGKQEFWGLEFQVAPGILIPRPETEHVMEVVLARLGERGLKIHMDTGAPRETIYVADVGTGSGCLAVALAYELPHAKVFATDISTAALEVAKRNAERNDVADRVTFLEGDLLKPFLAESNALPKAFDVIGSNPPYIGREEEMTLQREVREHEPHSALFAGATGLELYGPLVEQAAALLKDRGILALELGHDSADYVRGLFDGQSGWTNVAVTLDLAGIPRVLAAQRSR
ncbi:MAG: peptide chain release factor N(5)-glutamine methyltransferase [Candidatus Acidiferrales bacterium]|jgi:release factor glutamine methyltransferase